jgi:hypothetical protein
MTLTMDDWGRFISVFLFYFLLFGVFDELGARRTGCMHPCTRSHLGADVSPTGASLAAGDGASCLRITGQSSNAGVLYRDFSLASVSQRVEIGGFDTSRY